MLLIALPLHTIAWLLGLIGRLLLIKPRLCLSCISRLLLRLCRRRLIRRLKPWLLIRLMMKLVRCLCRLIRTLCLRHLLHRLFCLLPSPYGIALLLEAALRGIGRGCSRCGHALTGLLIRRSVLYRGSSHFLLGQPC